jgi:hypothetical protein
VIDIFETWERGFLNPEPGERWIDELATRLPQGFDVPAYNGEWRQWVDDFSAVNGRKAIPDHRGFVSFHEWQVAFEAEI